VQRHQIGDKLGERPVPTHVVRVGTGKDEGTLLTAVRIRKSQGLSADEVSEILSSARLLENVTHANLAQALEPVIAADEVLILSEFVDGESLATLNLAPTREARPTLEVWLRVLLDALTGLQALHAVTGRDGRSSFHSEVTPANVVVGVDGITRLIHTCRIPGFCIKVPGAPPYLAPEILLQEADVDFRADLHEVGAMLWEALTGQRLFQADKTSVIIRQLLTGALPPARPSKDKPWAAALVPIVARALSIDRAGRHPSADELRTTIEAAAAGHAASHEDVSRWVCAVAGQRIVDRRARHGGLPLELPRHAPPPPVPMPPFILSPAAPAGPLPIPFVPEPFAPPPDLAQPPPDSAPLLSDPLVPVHQEASASSRKLPWWLWPACAGAGLIALLAGALVWFLQDGSADTPSASSTSGEGSAQAPSTAKAPVETTAAAATSDSPREETPPDAPAQPPSETDSFAASPSRGEPASDSSAAASGAVRASPDSPFPAGAPPATTPAKQRNPKRSYDPLGI
jgi:serine/threonine-protein kinase